MDAATTTSVLLIEDNPEDARLIERLLSGVRRGSYAVESVNDLAQALERLQAGGIHLVLMDLTLPDSQGIDTLRTVVELVPELPIVVLMDQEDDAQATLAL